jgi:hypothetical protein
MKKTAVEWLRQELEYLREYEEFYTKRYMEVDALFNEAKEIEKQQIIEAVDVCVSTVQVSEDGSEITALCGESFYKEAYILKTI